MVMLFIIFIFRSNESCYSFNTVQQPSSQSPFDSSLNSPAVNVQNALSPVKRRSDLSERRVNHNLSNNSSLSNALGAPPPPPPPPENSSSQNSAQHSQTFGIDPLQFNHSYNNQSKQELNTSNPPPGFDHRGNIPFNHVQNNSTRYANYGSAASYPSPGYYPGSHFNNGIQANNGGVEGQINAPYGNNQLFPNQNQRPRFWR